MGAKSKTEDAFLLATAAMSAEQLRVLDELLETSTPVEVDLDLGR